MWNDAGATWLWGAYVNLRDNKIPPFAGGTANAPQRIMAMLEYLDGIVKEHERKLREAEARRAKLRGRQ